MRSHRLWEKLLGLNGCRVERVDLTDTTAQLSVRLHAAEAGRCPVCSNRCKGYDARGVREWRALDLGLLRCVVTMPARRVWCAEHGARMEAVPWARMGSAFTRRLEDHVAWMSARTSRSAVSTWFRMAWATVTRVVQRVVEERRALRAATAPRRIGIDEVSHRRGHRYVTVVVDHDTGELLYAAEGKGEDAVAPYFEQLGPERCGQIEFCSMDAAPQFKAAVAKHCPNARICMDPFHVVQWMTNAVDEVRRTVWRSQRKSADGGEAIKSTRWVLITAKEHLTATQLDVLGQLELRNKPLYRAWLLKEQLREVFKTKGSQACEMLGAWLKSALGSGIPAVEHAARSVANNEENIKHALLHSLSNARVESLNTRMQLLTRTAFGFHTARAFIAMAYLKLGGLCPTLDRT